MTTTPEAAIVIEAMTQVSKDIESFVESFEPERYSGEEAVALYQCFSEIERLAATIKALLLPYVEEFYRTELLAELDSFD